MIGIRKKRMKDVKRLYIKRRIFQNEKEWEEKDPYMKTYTHNGGHMPNVEQMGSMMKNFSKGLFL